MKKIKYLLLLFVTVLCLTGCGKDNSKQELKDAFAKMTDINAMTMKASVTMGSDELKIPYSAEVSTNGKDMHMKVSVSFAGIMEQTEEMYMIAKENEVYIYTYDAEENDWFYIKSTDSYNSYTESINQIFSATNISEEDAKKNTDEFFDVFDSVKKVKSDKDGYTKYELKITKKKMLEQLKKNIEDEEDETALKEMEESFKDFPDSLTFNIYLKDGRVAIMSADLSNVSIPMDTLQEGMNIKIYEVSIEYVAFNDDVKIELPKEVEENATYIDTDSYFEDLIDGEM